VGGGKEFHKRASNPFQSNKDEAAITKPHNPARRGTGDAVPHLNHPNASGPMPVVLVPAYKPEPLMVGFVRRLRDAGFPVLLVDDGGGDAYRALFDEARSLGATVARHAVNLGKGRALKTGINEILQRYPGLDVVTADADGQHTVKDILAVADKMAKCPDALVMGVRSFHGKVPRKSLIGNTITRWVYKLVSGVHCSDTQTGLRGLPASSLNAMLTIPGERYEYEMNVLLWVRRLGIHLREVPIQTVYINDNKGSHFNPLRDAMRIYGVIFKYIASSLVCTGLDYALYALLLHLSGSLAALSYVGARTLSSLANFLINKNVVFGARGGKYAAVRYYALVIAQMCLGALLVKVLYAHLTFNPFFAKIPVDMALFFLGYWVQKTFVFPNAAPQSAST